MTDTLHCLACLLHRFEQIKWLPPQNVTLARTCSIFGSRGFTVAVNDIALHEIVSPFNVFIIKSIAVCLGSVIVDQTIGMQNIRDIITYWD